MQIALICTIVTQFAYNTQYINFQILFMFYICFVVSLQQFNKWQIKKFVINAHKQR